MLKLTKVAAENAADAADYKAAGVAATVEGGWPMPVVMAHNKNKTAKRPAPPETSKALTCHHRRLTAGEREAELQHGAGGDGPDGAACVRGGAAAQGRGRAHHRARLQPTPLTT